MPTVIINYQYNIYDIHFYLAIYVFNLHAMASRAGHTWVALPT